MFDRTGKLDRFFKATVSYFKLVVRNAFSAEAVAARTAHAQQGPVDRNLYVLRSDACQIDFHDPPFAGAIHIGSRTPQPPRRATVARALDYAKVTVKRIAGHREFLTNNIEGSGGIR